MAGAVDTLLSLGAETESGLRVEFFFDYPDTSGFELRAAITEPKHPSKPQNGPHGGQPSTIQERE